MKFGDIEQLETKIVNQRKRKLADPKQKHSVVVEDNYLKIISHLKDSFKNQSRISAAEILTLTDQFIRGNNFSYFARKNPIALNNLFYDEADRAYDVAFFNRAASNFIECRHKYQGLSSVFYARFEEKEDHVLIGNLQIDDRHKNNASAQNDFRTVLLMRKNIYRAMIQESIKFALAGKKLRILFQTGDSEQHTQKDNLSYRLKKVKINNQNYAKYCAMHEKLLKKFDALQLGDSGLNFNYGRLSHGVIIEKSPDSYTSVFNCYPSGTNSLLSAVHEYYNQALERRYYLDEDERIQDLYVKIRAHNQTMFESYYRNNPTDVLNEINKIFTVIEHNYRENNRKEKLTYLREHISASHSHETIRGVIDKFLIKFRYHEIFLNRLPFMCMIKSSEVTKKNCFSGNIFFDSRYEPLITETFDKSKIIVPQIGKTLLVNENFPGQELIEADFFEKTLYNFYDKELPKLFTQAGLKFKKTIIRTKIDGKIVKSTAWEIKTGLEKFKERPFVIF